MTRSATMPSKVKDEMATTEPYFCWPSGGGNDPRPVFDRQPIEPYFGGFGDFKIKTGG